jgi:hypothetical protein
MLVDYIISYVARAIYENENVNVNENVIVITYYSLISK